MKIIEMNHVTFTYRSFDTNVPVRPAVNDFSLDIEEGEFVALVGHNGSGKSTLAKLLNGLLTPSSGEIKVLGLSTTNGKDLFEIRKNLGVVFQNPDNQMVATIVEDDVAFGPENIGIPSKEIRERVDYALRSVGMEAYSKHAGHRLSGGQKQRVAIAGVLAVMPKIIVLDESTAMLDPIGRREVMSVIRTLNKEQGMTVILITHFMEEAAEADRIVVLDDGRLALSGAPVAVFENEPRLRAMGLDVPVATEIRNRLVKKGYDLPNTILFWQQLVEALCQLKQKI